ncbi:MAG: MarR family winged helix-turn-helix transcriptional regulator [Christensenellales bacterium]|jgi:DNA-binding MarR family transcriptional regulator
MKRPADVLLSIRRTFKLYGQCLEGVRQAYGLTQMEMTIISFLHNNPGKDTVGEIAEVRMLPKGNVSQGVDSLMRKRLLARADDPDDRRKRHLLLRPEALPIVEQIEQANENFAKKCYAGFSPEELALYEQFTDRLMQNTIRELERRENDHA